MEIPEELIDQIVDEIIKELEEAAQREGRQMTFDDIEGSIFQYRQKLGEKLMQRSLDSQGTGKMNEKKTVRYATRNTKKKELKKKK